jgi:hypothetical protein
VRVEISSDAADFIGANGGELWVWAARPRMCCGGTPALMRAATAPPAGVIAFMTVPVPQASVPLTLHFRPTAGMQPDVLEIALTGRRHPRVAAYWDGCVMAMA